jgi:hypothetical protein
MTKLEKFGIVGWGLIAVVVIAGSGFYAGCQYKTQQTAATKAAVHDALKAAATPTAVAQAVK